MSYDVDIKKDVSFLYVIQDLETFITEVSEKLKLNTSLANPAKYPAFTVTGNPDDEKAYYPTKLYNTRIFELSGDVSGSAYFNGLEDVNIEVDVDPTKHVHSKPYTVSTINITTTGWTEESSGAYYSKVIEVTGMLATETIIPQLSLSGIIPGEAWDNILTDYNKLRQFIPTNGYITIHARTVPTYPFQVKLIRLH